MLSSVDPSRTLEAPIEPFPTSLRRARSLRTKALIRLRRCGTRYTLPTRHLYAQGLTVIHDSPLPVSEPCDVSLRVLFGGEMRRILAQGKIATSICAGDHFRASIVFTSISEETLAAVAQLLSRRYPHP